jgi:sterol 3beta-glucosyltransferase
VVPPLDYSDWIRVTGYWFLDEASEWKPSEELSTFIAKARADEKKLVYVGFGSITVDDRMAVVKTIANAVVKADVRCIWATGWSARGGSEDEKSEPTTEDIQRILPKEVLQIDGAPHDWLFKQVDAAVHHGGCGTTGASLRAGTPTVIKPFFGDQYFFANRVEDLGVGIYLRKLNESLLARALWEATHSDRMIKHAQALGERIRSEDGVATAIKAIYRDMEYAKTLIKRRRTQVEDNEESWTFIGDESDPEIQRQIAEFTSAATQAAAAGEKVPEEVETALGSVLLNAANKNL